MSKRGWKKLEDQSEVEVRLPLPSKMVAQKDFVISHNGYERKIKSGDDIGDVPSMYHENLKTEKVI